MKNLLPSLLKAQRELPGVPKDATNPAFRSRYATLGAVQDAAFPALHKQGLLVTWMLRSTYEDGQLFVTVTCVLFHAESGEELHCEIMLLPSKADPQGVGSAITYGRRYTLMSMLGLVADDDDGNAASGPPQQQRQQPARPAKPSAPWQLWDGPQAAIEWATGKGLTGAAEEYEALKSHIKPKSAQAMFEAWHGHVVDLVLDIQAPALVQQTNMSAFK